MSVKTVPFIIVAVLFSVAGQLFVKKGLNLLHGLDFGGGLTGTYTKILLSPYVLLGTTLYCVSVLFWLYSLTKVELSYAAPFIALTYIFIVLASWMFLGESVSLMRWIGVVVVSVGVLIVSFS
jgi:drug/metabolite transporter (DMT)-like permease